MLRTKGGEEQDFDVVLLTMPAPQILHLLRSSSLPLQEGVEEGLGSVAFTSRFALGVFYPTEVSLGGREAARYITDDPVFRFVSLDASKRGCSSSSSVVLHTSAAFGHDNLERTKEEVIINYL